jgi:hypothetical protein
MSELRDRIAAVLGNYLADDLKAGHTSMLDAADAVIREVGLSMKPQEIVEDWHGKCSTYD